jgi:hypothetical protein
MIATAEGRPKEKRATNVASLLSITKICAHLREQIDENKGFKAGGHGLPFAAFAECNQLHKPDCFLMIVRLAEAQSSDKQASETFWTNGISYECKSRHERAANQKAENEFIHASVLSGLPMVFPILFDDSRHSRGRIPQPIRFPLLQVVQNLGRLTFRTQMDVCSFRAHRMQEHRHISMLRQALNIDRV